MHGPNLLDIHLRPGAKEKEGPGAIAIAVMHCPPGH